MDDLQSEEKVYNFYYFVEDGLIKKIGVVEYSVFGNDMHKLNWLKSHAQDDLERAVAYPVSPFLYPNSTNVPYEDFVARQRVGKSIEFFEHIFVELNAPANPLYIASPVINGKVAYDIQLSHHEFPVSSTFGHEKANAGMIDDYLDKYYIDRKLNIPKLIDDEHFSAVKLLFNNQKYVSSIKVLMTCLDTIAYLEFGPKKNVFIQWLHTYARLDDIHITPEELWEFRNSVLHMSNLDSRKVVQGKVNRISFFISADKKKTFSDCDTKYFDFMSLISVISEAVGRWVSTYSISNEKVIEFVKRYDRIICDARLGSIPLTKS